MIYIPTRIRVGYQNRNDTYTGKLAYVIYYDEEDKLRKERSWNSWRSKDIDPQDFDNSPVSGFVLNKKVGGYQYHYDMRQTYVRVYDPRGFEFEISVPNLLFILENTSSIKGKGLEGEFVYGWDGTELILVPTSSPDYTELIARSERQRRNEFLTPSELKPGFRYLNRHDEEIVYMGKFPAYHWDNTPYPKKYHFFFRKKTYAGKEFWNLDTRASLNKCIIQLLDEAPAENYPDLVDKMEHSRTYCPVDPDKITYRPMTLVEFVSSLRCIYYTAKINSEKYGSTVQVMHMPAGLPARISYTRKPYPHPYSLDRHEHLYDSWQAAYEDIRPLVEQHYLTNGNVYAEKFTF